MKRATVASRAGLAVALFAIACTESIGPERGYPGVPLFSYSPNGITMNKQNGTLGESGRLLIKGFNPTNPHHGDAIIATFYWINPSGSTGNIIDSVRDVLTTAPSYTPVGNQYHLVEYVQAGSYSMATYIATNVQGFPDPNTDPNSGDILAVGAYLSDSVADGGVALSSWTGVEDNFDAALGNHRSASGSGAAGTAMPAQAGPIAINAGALAYTVTMSGLYILDGPAGYTSLGQGSDNFMKEGGAYAVQTSAGTMDPVWQWFNGSGSTGTWLATNLALNMAPPPAGNGNLTATTNTSGSSVDPDGYVVSVDGGAGQPIPVNGSVTFDGESTGSHSVALSDLATNCTASGGDTQTVNVPSGGTATAAFSVSCTATTGNLTVSTSTTGSSLDPDGYTVTVDGGSPQAIGINASVSYTNLATGNHTVAITGVAANCTVSGGPSQTVSVPSGGTATAPFTVSCAATTGNLTVTTSTTGSSLDPDGYTVTVDGSQSQAIASNNSTGITFTGLSAASHSVVLSGVAANCTVSGGNTQTVTVPSGGTATAAFTVSCAATTGNLTAQTSTTGSSVPSSYTVAVDGGAGQSIATSGSFTFTNLAATNHTVVLTVPSNCSITNGSASRSATVPSGGTVTVSYTVNCITPNSAPVVNAGSDETVLLGVLYSTSFSFSDPDNGPWNYTIDWGDGSTSSGSRPSAGSFSASHTYLGLSILGTRTIRVTITDSRGASGSDTKNVTIVLL